MQPLLPFALRLATLNLGLGLLVLRVWAEAAPMAPPEARTLPADHMVQRWQTDEGLPQSSITTIAQTEDGYLWLGTFQGLARFDGKRFVVFDAGNTPELRSSRIVDLYVDRQNTLWIRSEFGDLTRLDHGRFVNVASAFATGRQAETMPPQSLRDGARILGEDAAGTFWVRSGADCLAWREGKFVKDDSVHELESSTVEALAGGSPIFWDGDGRRTVWLSRASRSADELPHVFRVGHAPLDRLWARSLEGMAKIQNGRCLRHVPFPAVVLFGGVLCEDRKGYLWAAVLGEGLYEFGPGESVRRIKSPDGSDFAGVRCAFEDREGNLWVGTEGVGLMRLRPRTFANFGPPEGVATPLVKSVMEDATGTTWILSGSQVSLLTNGQTSVANPPGLAVPNVWCGFVDRAGTVWLGGYASGLYRYDHSRLERVTLPGGEKDWVVTALFEDHLGALWAGGNNLIRVENSRMEHFGLPDPFHGLTVRAIAEDQLGRMYFGLQRNGLLRLDRGPAGPKWTHFGPAEGFALDSLTALFVDASGTLWIGNMEGGLSRFKDGRLFVFPERVGLPRNVFSIVEDATGAFWFGSSHGVYRVLRRNLEEFASGQRDGIEPIQYTRAEGLGSTECAGGFQPAVWKTREGNLWFPTINGASVVDPKTLPFNPQPPPIVIEEVVADSIKVGALDHAGNLAAANVETPAGVRRVEIHYTALSFTAPEKVRFRYRLEGLDPHWTDAGHRREAYFQGLAPGTYQFQVTACNNDGVWNETGARLRLVVLPLYWQTWWFQALVAAGLAATLAAVARHLALRKVRRRMEMLERQHALDGERARIAKDMHDDLGSSLTRISMLGEIAEAQLDQPDQARASVRQISDTSRSVVRTMDEILWALNPKNDTLENLATFICQFAREHLALGNIQCRLDLPVALPDFPLNSEVRHNLLLAVKETLNNVLKHSAASEVKLSVTCLGRLLEITISDNGKGFLPGNVTAGDGLANLPARLRAIGGECALNSAPGHGTTVRIRLPLHHSGA